MKNPGRVRSMGVGMNTPFDPFKSIRKLADTYTDEKIVLARKLARDGYTYEQMAPLLGYNNGGSVRNYFKVNNLPKPDNRHGPVQKRAEDQKISQSKKMKEYWATQTAPPNRWQPGKRVPNVAKDGAMKITLPAWAEEAVELRKNGMSGPAIARKLGVSDAYVYTTLNIISGKGTTRVKWAQDAIMAANEGKTNEEIAKVVGVSTNRVRDVLAQHQASVLYRKNKETKEATEASMADRKFEATHQTENGLTRNGVLIRCGVDGCFKTERFIRSHGTVNPTQAAQYFRTKGWIIGGGPRADRCPDHAYNKKPAEPVKAQDMSPFHPGNNKPEVAPGIVDQKVPVDPMIAIQDRNEVAHDNAVAALVEEPLRHMVEDHEEAKKEMSKADRRIIFNKIEDVYGDETIGYKGDWSDEKVSEDLGVSVEWVALIREENFGPARNQSLALKETREAGQKVMEAIEAMRDFQTNMKKAADTFDENWRLCDEKFAEFKGLTDAFSSLYKSIAK